MAKTGKILTAASVVVAAGVAATVVARKRHT